MSVGFGVTVFLNHITFLNKMSSLQSAGELFISRKGLKYIGSTGILYSVLPLTELVKLIENQPSELDFDVCFFYLSKPNGKGAGFLRNCHLM